MRRNTLFTFVFSGVQTTAASLVGSSTLVVEFMIWDSIGTLYGVAQGIRVYGAGGRHCSRGCEGLRSSYRRCSWTAGTLVLVIALW